MTKDLSDIANSIQAAYEQMYSGEVEELSEGMEVRKMTARQLAAFEKKSKGMSPSDKKALASISRMNKGDYSHVGGEDSSKKADKSPTKGSLTTGTKRTTKMRNVIVSHYLHDEGFADTLDSAEIMADVISESWVDEIVEAAKDQSDNQLDRGMKTTYKAQNALDNSHQGRLGKNIKPLSPEGKQKMGRMRDRLKARRDDISGERNSRQDKKMADLKKQYGI